MEKPTFGADQIVSSSMVSRHFKEVRQKAKSRPQFITENGVVDAVILDYQFYEDIYCRLRDLEEMEEARVLRERIDRLEADPACAKSWRAVRRSV